MSLHLITMGCHAAKVFKGPIFYMVRDKILEKQDIIEGGFINFG